MEIYNVRVTPLSEDVEQQALAGLQQFLLKHCESWVFTREFGGRLGKLHFQGWVKSRLKRDYFNKNARNAMKGHIGTANAGMGINENDIRDFEALQRYVVKGENKDILPVVLTSQGLQGCVEDYVVNYHKAYWEQNAQIKKIQKDKKRTMFDMLYGYAESVRPVPSRQEIASKYVEICCELDKPVDVYRGRSLVNLVWAKYDPEAKRSLVDAICEKL